MGFGHCGLLANLPNIYYASFSFVMTAMAEQFCPKPLDLLSAWKPLDETDQLPVIEYRPAASVEI
jgi:hypothetical protein